MFKNRALQVKLIKTPKMGTDIDVGPEEILAVNPEQIAKIAGGLIFQTALSIGAIILAKKTLDILGDVIKIALKAKLN